MCTQKKILSLILYFALFFVENTLSINLLPPANEVCEGYVFIGVCLSTGGVSAPLHAGTHTLPLSRYTPLSRFTPRQVHPPGQTPPSSAGIHTPLPNQCMLGYTSLLMQCMLGYFQQAHWNAFFFF